MPWHASSDRVDGEADIDPFFRKHVVKLANFMLRLGDGHAVSGNDYHFVRRGQNGGGFFGICATNDSFFLDAR